MIKLEYTVMSSKISWIKRLFHKSIPWIKLFRHTILRDLQRMTNCGPEYGSVLKRKTCDSFWLDTFGSWETLNNKMQFHQMSKFLLVQSRTIKHLLTNIFTLLYGIKREW